MLRGSNASVGPIIVRTKLNSTSCSVTVVNRDTERFEYLMLGAKISFGRHHSSSEREKEAC